MRGAYAPFILWAVADQPHRIVRRNALRDSVVFATLRFFTGCHVSRFSVRDGHVALAGPAVRAQCGKMPHLHSQQRDSLQQRVPFEQALRKEIPEGRSLFRPVPVRPF